ncbi:FHA domain-containing protein [Sinomonas sp. JGH33]|uniref:FHA domain-containing protein n=1 Tax=Sinomonas terricola TaxID=3110330 RepID=A0ABU5T4V4_9MICC|nr:FHA domain-containing protein [Sinomonas sp. JGH33]MEA5454695.1 FHA domain-containing protein [Sinomonas sp. JGH33]
MHSAEHESGYIPGEGWTAAVRGRIAVLVPSSAAGALVSQLWGPLGPDADLYAVLGVLTREHGLGDLPPFGILERGERLRLVVRGAVSARVTTARGTEEVSGADVGTWAERAVDAWSGAQLEAVGPRTPPVGASADRYPLADGAARAVAVFVGAAVRTRGPDAAEPPRAEAPGAAASADTELGETLTPFETEAAVGEAAESSAPPVGGPRTPEPSAPEATTGTTAGYDHLWEQTVVRRVEDAAMRPSVEEPAAATTAPEAEAPEAEAPAGAPRRDTQPDHALRPPSEPRLSNQPRASNQPPPLIQSVPWSSGASEQRRSITSELFGDHDGETIVRSELDAAPAPEQGTGPSPESGVAPAPGPGPGPSPPGRTAPGEPRADAPLVLGRACPSKHANPPTNAQCRVCGVPLSGEARQLPRPPLGRVRFADGDVVELVEPLVVGRQPSVSRVPSGAIPRLVTVESPSGDISRNHLEVRLEGWHVMVRDLKATNGTVIEREGQPARRLGQGEMAIVLDGDVADLGDGVTLTFEDVP